MLLARWKQALSSALAASIAQAVWPPPREAPWSFEPLLPDAQLSLDRGGLSFAEGFTDSSVRHRFKTRRGAGDCSSPHCLEHSPKRRRGIMNDLLISLHVVRVDT